MGLGCSVMLIVLKPNCELKNESASMHDGYA
jgi:hypothetical protein